MAVGMGKHVSLMQSPLDPPMDQTQGYVSKMRNSVNFVRPINIKPVKKDLEFDWPVRADCNDVINTKSLKLVDSVKIE